MQPLESIEACFQGVVPAYLATRSADGEPNVTAMSIVHLLGPRRLGVSCQFMNKTLRNLRDDPRAQIVVMDAATMVEYTLDVDFVGTTDSGPVFERMSATLDAVASQSGMAGVFALVGVAQFDVVDWRRTSPDPDVPVAQAEVRDPLEVFGALAAVVAGASALDGLFESLLAALDAHLGLAHAFLLLSDEDGARLYNVASRGFPAANFGAEIAVGEGLYGVAVARRLPVRSGSLSRDRLLLHAARRDASTADPCELPLPGLLDAESSLAVPLVFGDRCLGALCFQSTTPGAFTAGTERVLVLLAHQLAATMVALGTGSADIFVSARRGPVGARALATRFKCFESDGSVFVDDQYLIKGVAGRVLFRVLSNYVHEQRDEFSSKEIRLDPFIGLPALKDNLEARLITLRKRLEERTPHVRIEHVARGRFRLEVHRELLLERLP